jgi:hypothetical protein
MHSRKFKVKRILAADMATRLKSRRAVEKGMSPWSLEMAVSCLSTRRSIITYTLGSHHQGCQIFLDTVTKNGKIPVQKYHNFI